LRLYETTLITSSQLEDNELEKEIKTVEDIIKSNDGNLVETQRWGVRRFAYEIKRQKQGIYTHFLYEADPGIPAALAASFKVNERIMRFLTVKSIPEPVAEEAKSTAPTPAAEAAPAPAETPVEAPTEKPAEPETPAEEPKPADEEKTE
jgi:small subunit ribosomal protein S6